MVHKRWVSTAWPDTVDRHGRVGPFHDLIGRTVRLDGVELSLLAAYFNCHDGIGGGDIGASSRGLNTAQGWAETPSLWRRTLTSPRKSSLSKLASGCVATGRWSSVLAMAMSLAAPA